MIAKAGERQMRRKADGQFVQVKATRRDKDAPRTKVDPKPFNQLVARASIKRIRLIGTKFDLRPSALSEDKERWSYRVSDNPGDWHLDCDAELLRGEFTYTAACTEGRNKPVSLVATYLATWAVKGECEEAAAQAYLARVGRFACYPYFRALFAILTEQSGLQLPPLPVISEGPRFIKAD